jgi:hypothetical protein
VNNQESFFQSRRSSCRVSVRAQAVVLEHRQGSLAVLSAFFNAHIVEGITVTSVLGVTKGGSVRSAALIKPSRRVKSSSIIATDNR